MSNYGELGGYSLREVQDQLLMLLPAEFFLLIKWPLTASMLTLCQRNEQVLGYQKDYVEGIKQTS